MEGSKWDEIKISNVNNGIYNGKYINESMNKERTEGLTLYLELSCT